MDKTRASRWCGIISAGLLTCFIVKTIADRARYLNTFNSAPFYVWVLANALYFILPAAIIAVIGVIISRKSGN